MAATAEKDNLDLNLYSRQIYVLGLDTMRTLGKTNVLISGMKGLGVETAKNIILAGPKSVTVHDDEVTTLSDLSSQFYLTEADIGKNRAEASVNKLAELNNYVKVKAITGELTEEELKNYQVVIFTNNRSLEKVKRLADFCHNQSPPIAVVVADARGAFAQAFVDFGPSFVVTDGDGEEYPSQIVTGITHGAPATVTVHDESRLFFETGDTVVFEEVQGATELNGKEFVATVTGPYSFTINDTTKFGQYTTGGTVRKVKTPKTLNFAPFSESIKEPELMMVDLVHFDRPSQLHLGFLALLQYQDKHNGELPQVGNEEQAQEIVAIAKEINATTLKVEEVDEKIIKTLALHSRGDINPMNAFLGGIIAQEALKISGKFTPIKQWFYFDAVEVLPEKLSQEELAPLGSRYDANIATFGRSVHESLTKLKLFLIGAGALGCELLKNFALLGVATSQDGIVHLTDMDTIEKSNLNRQFLFRESDLEQLKSATAAKAVKAMNPAINVKSYEIPVGPENENVFHEVFWEKLDLAVNALDNVKARLYVDSQCVTYKKPLLESGTLGTKANTQVVLPYKTESYGSSADPPEKAIPICTLKNFPHAIEHTIQWARDLFEGLFTSAAQDANNYLDDPEYVEKLLKSQNPVASKRATLETINDLLTRAKTITYESCIEEARNEFENLFANKIKQLLFNFPLDHVTESGVPFWSGPKRPPTPLVFDAKNPTHMAFIVTASNLLATTYGLKEQHTEPEYFEKVLAGIKVPPFEPKAGVRLQSGEKDNTTEGGNDDDEVVNRLSKSLPPRDSLGSKRLVPAAFEKDDDTNFHIDFITAASNLRAANYAISEADRNTTKRIAGRIIPAIATTTSMVTGLVCLELLKVIQKEKLEKIENFKNAFVNLALPLFAFSEPLPPAKHVSDLKAQPPRKVYPEGWSLWDSLEVDIGDVTLKEFIRHIKEKHNLDITSMAAGTSLIYTTFMPTHQARLERKLSEVWKEASKREFGAHQQFIELVAEVDEIELENGETAEVDLPTIRFKFRHLA